jgi:hypothetical protein
VKVKLSGAVCFRTCGAAVRKNGCGIEDFVKMNDLRGVQDKVKTPSIDGVDVVLDFGFFAGA